jgi:hypothetical protein
MKTFLRNWYVGTCALLVIAAFGACTPADDSPEVVVAPKPVMGTFKYEGKDAEFTFTSPPSASVRAPVTVSGKLKYDGQVILIKVTVDGGAFSFVAIGDNFLFTVDGTLTAGALKTGTATAKFKSNGQWSATETLTVGVAAAVTIKDTDKPTDHTAGVLSALPAKYLGTWSGATAMEGVEMSSGFTPPEGLATPLANVTSVTTFTFTAPGTIAQKTDMTTDWDYTALLAARGETQAAQDVAALKAFADSPGASFNLGGTQVAYSLQGNVLTMSMHSDVSFKIDYMAEKEGALATPLSTTTGGIEVTVDYTFKVTADKMEVTCFGAASQTLDKEK